NPAWLGLGRGETADVVAESTGVGEKERCVKAEDDKAGHHLGVRVLLLVVYTWYTRNATQRRVIGPPGAAKHIENRKRHGQRDALQDAEERHAKERCNREEELGAPLAPESHEARNVCQRDRGGDHHG